MDTLKKSFLTREFAPERIVRTRPVVQPTLGWVLRLRWTAFAGQFVTILLALFVLKMQLPVAALMSLVAFGSISNGILHFLGRKPAFRNNAIIGSALILDSLLLTGLLSLSGGPENPFTTFYILQVTLAALMLGLAWAVALLVICFGCFASLFFLPPDFLGANSPVMVPHSLHLEGMLFAFILMGSAVGYFVSQLSRSLQQREKELAESRFLATQNERFAALASLAGGVAHELATPLGTIAIISKEIWSEAKKSKEASSLAEDAALLRQEVDRCREILQRMNDQFTSGMGESPQLFNIRDVLREVEIKCRRDSGGRLVLDDFEDQRVYCARRPLVESLVALVRNAVDASPPDATVHIRTSVNKGVLCFEVEDHGVGISNADLNRLGEPFFSTKSPGKGMGLGVFLVRTFIHRIGGRLRFNSDPGKGTSVFLEIPMHPNLEVQS